MRVFDVVVRVFVLEQLVFILFLVSHVALGSHLLMRVRKIGLTRTNGLILFLIFQITFLADTWPTSDKLQKITFSSVVLPKLVGERINGDGLLSRELVVDNVVVELGEVLFDSQELFELVRFLNGWDHDEVLEVLLEHVSPVVHGVADRVTAAWNTHGRRSSLDILEAFLSELVAALGELDARVLVDERLVKVAEGLVLLSHVPSLLVVEADLDEVLGIDSMIYGVLRHLGVSYLHVEAHLEEVGAAEVVEVLRATLDVLHEDLRRVEAVTELALHRLGVLEALGEDFEFLHFLGELVIFALLLGNGLR